MLKKITLPIILITTTLVTSSCSFFSPKYEKPEIEVPALWNSQNKGIDNTKDWDLTSLAWWREFNDPVLNSLITTALKDNNSLQVSIGNILQANAEINKANYGWLPTASVGGGGFIAQTFDTNSSTNIPNLNIPRSTLAGGSLVGIIPSYTINIARQFKLGEISRFSKSMQENIKNATRLSIISQVSAAYFSLLTAQEQLKLQSQMVNQLELLYRYANAQHKLGANSPMLSELIKQQLESEKGKVAIINNDIVHFQNTLKILLGKNPGKITISRNFNDINADVKVPVNMPSQVLENRPDIAIAEYKLKTANANIGLARSQFFPSIDLTGTFGNATLALGELATMNAWAWAAQAVSAVPIFNMSILADSDKAKAQFYQGYYDYISTLQKAFQDVDDSLSERAANNTNFNKQKLSLESTRKQQSILYKQYQNGAISKAQLTGIALNILNQQMQTNQAKLKSLISVVNLYQALGSGYNVDNYSDPNYNNPAFDK
ncbi:efflux transporter outer membrane subunit [Allofrancisella frigidaquae]|uniref:Efflux transporter outer membrane subunit n=1 Tax=Allofrancisella frigidaquae TaxID=1085644 RepID=A0A6M3HUJ5_9GAMM|nr:efflux transporter outer membrane subunit [Allofrancisella frigidaquae]QIV94908.1 efflux transporter outer membrane subunit [Allofrancisella frigidaquae]